MQDPLQDTHGDLRQNKTSIYSLLSLGSILAGYTEQYTEWPTGGAAIAWPHTCRKGQEGLWFNKLSIVIEEIIRVELIWKFPLSLLFQN